MIVTDRLYTLAEFEEWAANFHGELHKGRIIEMAPASWTHGGYASRIDGILWNFVEEHKLGMTFGAETGFTLSEFPPIVRAPDCAFVRSGRIPADRETAFFPGAPDLAIEILSPKDRLVDVEEKVDEYLAAGTIEVWVLNPKRQTITVYRSGAQPHVLRKTDRLESGDLLPGLVIELSQLFE